MRISPSAAPLVTSTYFRELKDPSLTFDGRRFHIFATGCRSGAAWGIAHLTAPSPEGPWQEEQPCELDIRGPQVCAPSVVFENGRFHLFIQTAFSQLNRPIEHAVSADGHRFQRTRAILKPKQGVGFYDAEAVTSPGQHYLTYSAMTRVGHGDLFLARSVSNSWDGPWETVGRILEHTQVPFHNQHADRDYEWGLEGSHILALPDGRFLLTSVCFLRHGARGRRQRIFFSTAPAITGPYTPAEPFITPSDHGWDSGENGHGCALWRDDAIHLFYQARPPQGLWNIGSQKIDHLSAILRRADIHAA